MEGFIGQIILFAGTFAPRNWATCQGQLIPVANDSALFKILGYEYGGEEGVTFALPNMEGMAPEGLRYVICMFGDSATLQEQKRKV
jgi:microcystin-dependent protein